MIGEGDVKPEYIVLEKMSPVYDDPVGGAPETAPIEPSSPTR